MESHNEARIAEHDGSLPTVLMIVGSLRKQSLNTVNTQFGLLKGPHHGITQRSTHRGT